MGRLMGLDVGRRRIGIALSDPLGLTAQPYTVHRSRGRREDIEYLCALAEQEGVTEIVVGHPVRTDGSLGPEAAYVARFAQELERGCRRCTVTLWDERFTTHEAERALMAQGLKAPRRRELVDMAAAAIILESYMQRRRSGR